MTTSFESDREVLRARTMLNRYVGRDISQWLDDDDDAIDVVIWDLLSQWWRGDDLADFWTRYANAVEYSPPGSTNEYREGFGDGEDLEVYYRAVWAAHVSSLRLVAGQGDCTLSQPCTAHRRVRSTHLDE